MTVPAVIAVSSSATAVPGVSITVDLTNGATGGPFTSAQLVSLSPPTAGTALITMGDTASNSEMVVAALVAGGRYLLKFTPSATFSGTAIATFTLSNAFATSAAATITFKVVPRPDPSKDPEVIGLVNAQAQAAQHFASTQITNFNDRLEALHDSNCHRNAFHLGLTDSRMPVDTDPLQKTSAAKGNNGFGNNGFGNTGAGTPGLFGPATNDTGSGGTRASDSSAANGSPGRSDGAISRSGRRGAAAKGREPDDAAGCNGNEAVQRFAAWTGGYVNFGRLNTGISSTVDYFSTGVSAGVDYWFSPAFTGGIGFGYGNDKSTIGSNGTISTAFSYDVAAYGSWHPGRNTFVDAVVGYGIMSFTSSRYITGSSDVFANGERGGHQVFGSITSGYEYRDKGLLISPYGRVSASWSTLDPFTESGGGIFALQYGAQTISSFTGGFGLRGAYELRQSWGILAPRARIEYNHEFAGASTAFIAYADLVGIGGLTYALPITPTGSDYVTAGLGTDFNFLSGWVLGLDYRTTVGQERTMPQMLQFKLRTQF